MGVGGFQKSLVSLLRCFDYERYNVDLLLFSPSGIYMDLIPDEVNLLKPVIDPHYFDSGAAAVKYLFKHKMFQKAFVRLISCGIWLFDKSIGAAYMMTAVPGLKKQYDAAIDYNGQQILYYMVSKIRSKRKISYFHSDYKKWPYYEKWDRIAYRKVDAIVTVSDECVRSMKEVFPEYRRKIYCIENIVSNDTVNLFPKDNNTFQDSNNGLRLVTVGRVCKDKGFDYACDALDLLVSQGYDVHWYFVGPVTEPEFCRNCLNRVNGKDHITLLGTTNNPYDFMRHADIIVQPSRFEGKSVVIEEAKILHRPIIVTNFSTVKNQINDGITGRIVDMNAKSVYKGIKDWIDCPAKRRQISDNQKKLCHGNESEVKKVYALIEKGSF